MIFSTRFWKSLIGGIKSSHASRAPGLLQQDLTSAAIEDGQTLLARATEAWRSNDLDSALALMARAYAGHNTPEVSCYHATLLHYVGRSKEARDVLFHTIAAVPWFLPAQTQLARVMKIDQRANSDEASIEVVERRALVAAMRQALERDSFFKPSEFWDAIAAKHERMLDDFGINNFKRTVAHNYQNWLIVSAEDSQWQRLQSIWQVERFIEPVLNTIESADDAGMIWNVENPSYALSATSAMAVYKMATGILWEVALAGDTLGFLAGFEESTIGNPIRLRRNGDVPPAVEGWAGGGNDYAAFFKSAAAGRIWRTSSAICL